MADSHWRHTGNVTKVGPLDARAFSPFPFLLIIKSWSIVTFGFIFLVFFGTISRKGYSFSTFIRKLRTSVTGTTKSVRRLR